MKRLLFWIITLIICQSCEAQSQQEQMRQISAAERLLESGNTQEAINQFDKILESSPQLEIVLLLRCKAKYKLKDYQGAIDDAESILAINPDIFTKCDYTALTNLGTCRNNLRQFGQARQHLLRAQKLDSTDIVIYEGLAYGFLEEHNFTEAVRNYTRAAKINPTSKTLFYGLGKSYLQSNQYAQAIKAYDEAIKLDPQYAVAYQNRASAKYFLKDLGGCCADLKRCEELGISNAQVMEFREKVCK